MSLRPFLCHDHEPTHLHVRVEQSFLYNIVAVCGNTRIRAYEPWFHFEQIALGCQQVLAQLHLSSNATTQRAKCVQAMVLALVAERRLDLDELQVQQLYERALDQSDTISNAF